MSTPSVATLWAIVTELNLSLDRVIRGESFDAEGTSEPPVEDGTNPILHPGDRQAIDLASGVTWEDLSTEPDGGVDFVLATYEVGGASTPDGSLMQHRGREYGYVMTGTLGVQVGSEEYALDPGDSIAFESTRPHRLYNLANTTVQAIWFVIDGRTDNKPHGG